MKRLLCTIAAVLALTSCWSDKAEPKRPKRLIIVFADVTDSLKGEELQAVGKVLEDIFDRAPEKTQIIVLPVVPNMSIAEKAADYTIPFRSNTGAGALHTDAEERAKEARKAFDKIIAAGRQLQPHVPSSCLAAALQRAEGIIRSFPGYSPEVVFISDMVEECDHSIGGRKILLNHPHIEADIAAVKATSAPFADLGGAPVFIIYPSAINSGTDIDRKRAPADELSAFWTAVFAHCRLQMQSSITGNGVFHSEWKSARKLAEDADRHAMGD